MNVIFIDFDGVLNTMHYMTDEDEERKIKILADICHTYDCKVVIESAHKDCIDEKTLTSEVEWIQFIFDCFKKYEIDCIGTTPDVRNDAGDIWKENEIISYLESNPEIEHFCVIDDDDRKTMFHQESDLDKVRDHLILTKAYVEGHPEEEGLLPRHKEEIGKVLELENEFRVRKVR